MTLQMYADRKGWVLDRLETRLRHDRIHAEACAECETRSGMVHRIERGITVEGALDARQRAKPAEIADKCHAHRTLRGPLGVTPRLGGEGCAVADRAPAAPAPV